MPLLILMRHGQSAWNLSNRFTGWVDISLTDSGMEEARAAGKKISKLPIDRLFVSSLIRSQMSAMIAMNQHDSHKIPFMIHEEGKMREWAQSYDESLMEEMIPVHSAWQLNERYYGKLQGLNKQVTINTYGQEQVKLWRRSYDVPPPEGESLEMTAARTLPYFKEEILPFMDRGENLFVCAHGNSLRSIIMYLESMTPAQILEFELSTGSPVVYNYEKGSFTRIYL